MESGILISRIFGPFLAIVGLWMLLYGDNLFKTMSSMKSSPAAIYISSLITLFLGLVVINHYNYWILDSFIFVTLLGWLLFIRGLLGLFMAKVAIKFFMEKHSLTKAMGVAPLIWGLILIWNGYYY